MRSTRAGLAVLMSLLVATACSGASNGTLSPTALPTASPTASPSPTPSSGALVPTVVYLMRGEKLQPARRQVSGPAVLAASLRTLLAGPVGGEAAAGLTSAVPEGSSLRSVNLSDGRADVDLSSRFAAGGGSLSTQARLAELVFTATQFPTVRDVVLKLDGKRVTVFGSEGLVLRAPLTRADFADLTPAVLVESPAAGDPVSSPQRVTGTADVFEAVFHLELRDAEGKVLVSQRVQATSGTGTRGAFTSSLTFVAPAPGAGHLLGVVTSAKDGSRQVVQDVPVTFG